MLYTFSVGEETSIEGLSIDDSVGDTSIDAGCSVDNLLEDATMGDAAMGDATMGDSSIFDDASVGDSLEDTSVGDSLEDASEGISVGDSLMGDDSERSSGGVGDAFRVVFFFLERTGVGAGTTGASDAAFD